MQPESNPRNSFFDNDDLNMRFDFVKPDKSHLKHLNSPPVVKNSLSRHPSILDSPDQGIYALHAKLLAFYENLYSKIPQLVLDLAHSRLETLTLSDNQNYCFSLTKNGNTFKFYSHDKKIIEIWVAALKNVCVLLNFHEEYKALKMIGKGSFAKVYLVESKVSKRHFAVKAFTKEGLVISNKANAKPAMLNEIDIMRAIDHENVVKLYEVFETEKSIYLVLELIQGRSLQDMLKKGAFKEENSETKIMTTIRSILEALSYLASKRIMHRDLKPDNILLEKGEKVKIVDFGLATFIDAPEYIFKKCGTPGYIAPEVFKYDIKNPATSYDDHCDVFSIGGILFYMFFGTPFFEGSNASEILKNNRKFTSEFEGINIVKREINDFTSRIPKEEGLSLLLQLIEFDQKKRLSAAQAINHPYLAPLSNGVRSLQRMPSSQEYSQRLSRTGSFSPKIVNPLKRISSGSPDKLSPVGADRYRFTQKDSLYFELGRSENQARVDTTGGGNTQNSILFANRMNELSHINNTSNGSLSPPFGKVVYPDFKRPSSKTFKGALIGTDHLFYKTTMFRNMQSEESKDDSSPLIKLEQIKSDRKFRGSEQTTATTNPSSDKLRFGSHSPTYYRSDPISTESPSFQLKIEQVQNNPMILTRSNTLSTKWYQPFSQKN